MPCPRPTRAALAAIATIVAIGAVGITSAGCGLFRDPAPSDYPTQAVYTEDTRLGPGDIFEVRVFKHEDMTAAYSASAEGTISFPLIGIVAITGKTPAEVETEIRTRLADGYLRNPNVSVLVKEYKSKKVSVFGQVRRPGTLPFAEGMTIVEAVSQAGGFTPTARENAVSVTRGTGADLIKYIVPVESIATGNAATFYMRPGDSVFVPAKKW